MVKVDAIKAQWSRSTNLDAQRNSEILEQRRQKEIEIANWEYNHKLQLEEEALKQEQEAEAEAIANMTPEEKRKNPPDLQTLQDRYEREDKKDIKERDSNFYTVDAFFSQTPEELEEYLRSQYTFDERLLLVSQVSIDVIEKLFLGGATDWLSPQILAS